MAFNGKDLATIYLRKYGFRDSASRARVVEWLNDIFVDICASYDWAFLKTRIKKELPAGTQEVDLSPSIPSTPSIAIEGSGSFKSNDSIRAKVTFILFDDTKKEINSIESEGSSSSPALVITEDDKSVKITDIDTYKGNAVRPNIIHRRVYLSVNNGDFFLHKIIADNVTTEVVVSSQLTSSIRPPITGLTDKLISDPFLENVRRPLVEATLDDLIRYDANLERVGTPQYYVRTSATSVLIYPTTNDAVTISYFIKKIPSEVFDDAERVIQVPVALKETLEAGMMWKIYEDKDSNGQESKKMNYEAAKERAPYKIANADAKFGIVREVQ